MTRTIVLLLFFILMTRFAADGNRLVVIGTNQKAYFFDLSTVVP